MMNFKNKECEMFVIERNTTKEKYGQFTDQIIAVTKQGQTIIFGPEDLKLLEKAVGAKFKI